MNGQQPKRPTHRKERTEAGLLLYPQNRVLCRLGDSEFDDGLGWNLDLLLRLWIKARARLPLLLYEFAKTGQDKFAVLFNLFVGDVAERIEKYSSGPFVGLGGFGKCALKFGFCHLSPGLCQRLVIRVTQVFLTPKTSAAAPPRKSEPWRPERRWSVRTEAFRSAPPEYPGVAIALPGI